jgi:preprotein translocase subunit YajC
LTVFAFQQLPAERPVRTEVGQSAPTEAQQAPEGQVQEPPRSDSFGGMGPLMPMLLMMVPLFLLMWWMGRSQQKRQEKALSVLKKGDKVITQGGFIGKLLEVGDRYAKVELAPGVKVELLKTSLLGKDTGDNQPEARR